jgi:hypothetical protein
MINTVRLRRLLLISLGVALFGSLALFVRKEMRQPRSFLDIHEGDSAQVAVDHLHLSERNVEPGSDGRRLRVHVSQRNVHWYHIFRHDIYITFTTSHEDWKDETVESVRTEVRFKWAAPGDWPD